VPNFVENFSSWIFRGRTPLVWTFALLTAVMGWFALRLHVDASFNKSLPSDHPYIRTFEKYQSDFGGANRIIVALMANDGDIFTPEFFHELRAVTDEVMFLPAVDRPQVQSLFTPNVRYVEVIEDGFSGGNVIPADFKPTPENFSKVRENIIKSGKLGQLVANDFDDLLGRREGRKHLFAHSLFLNGFNELLDNFEVDVGFEQRHANFAQSGLHIRRRELTLTAQVFEDAL